MSEYIRLSKHISTLENEYKILHDKRKSPGPQLRKEISSAERRIRELEKEMDIEG